MCSGYIQKKLTTGNLQLPLSSTVLIVWKRALQLANHNLITRLQVWENLWQMKVIFLFYCTHCDMVLVRFKYFMADLMSYYFYWYIHTSEEKLQSIFTWVLSQVEIMHGTLNSFLTNFYWQSVCPLYSLKTQILKTLQIGR